MNNYEIKAYAKINLSLDIISKRKDGYHNLKMVMHQVKDLYDILIFKEAEGKLELQSNSDFLPDNENNIVYKAYNEFYNYTKLNKQGFNIELKKNIPVCAGLGGGSSDAAATINFLNNYHKTNLSLDELINIGVKVGADVPFLIYGGTCLAEGIGEKLTILPSLPLCYIVIAKPNNKGLSTKHIFSKVNIQDKINDDKTENIITGIKNNNLKLICDNMFNRLEKYSCSECKEIDIYKNILKENYALCALMSGSGNSVFGIFDNIENANKALFDLNKITNQVFLCKNV